MPAWRGHELLRVQFEFRKTDFANYKYLHGGAGIKLRHALMAPEIRF